MVDAINTHEQAQRDKNSTPVLLIYDRVAGKIYQAAAEPGYGIQQVQLMVWDPDALAPVRMTQPTVNIDGDLDVTVGDVEALLAGRYYKRVYPFTYASGRPKYICKNLDVDAATSDVDWYVWKYSDADIPESEGPRVATGGIASEAAVNALSWNI